MTAENTVVHEHAELIAGVAASLCVRTLSHFAQEARLDGESLKQAVERYEVDYAWHVLGSDRLRDEVVAVLTTKLAQPVSAALRTCVAEVLLTVASQQSAELLMSFDNDIAEHLAAALCARLKTEATPEAAGVN